MSRAHLLFSFQPHPPSTGLIDLGSRSLPDGYDIFQQLEALGFLLGIDTEQAGEVLGRQGEGWG